MPNNRLGPMTIEPATSAAITAVLDVCSTVRAMPVTRYFSDVLADAGTRNARAPERNSARAASMRARTAACASESRPRGIRPSINTSANGWTATPGVAQRANVSATWYTWLEQARGGAPSANVIDRIAGDREPGP
ncbi:helix-turn-helix domain-containing protein [Paraburkholderia sp. 5N]|uniref:Helix-turn-helix domain-containing protein n=1 Tax=Paraburkholderia elongata TaxID=2675747 RepID=A0A972NXQ0_9BURK|nr:helix-turn-helix domain-containing protein [Paraburkholderia elongata]